jgi:hypothetical protein
MEIQQLLVYVIVAVAIVYLVWKFILPKSMVFGKKKNSKSCGQDNCGCG